ncbi:type II 3-dehydroquinate dehydratase [Tumebacillus permanentifrigoris]|uniref:3-dehydroquinate dehydratase n=1 Tax=Tumebacillus permanentifrigoris TaxID=378543 RepID=A0A316D4F6_9BACL|nr:type II 3-dehydroquinate dehydratase [Tumebacillus permanentifrigoris]PWK06305.1 3-dehydroquinate dehydratase [Tumebacillus permanentifrigoris]
MAKLLVLHGPNLNLLGTREPDIYGRTTLEQINRDLTALAQEFGVEIDCYQSNHEGFLIDRLQAARGNTDGVIFNPGGYTHTSVALRDCIAAISIPTIEVHLSNVHAREEFRHRSMLAPVCMGQISGLGAIGYTLAFHALLEDLAKRGLLTEDTGRK